MTFFLLPCCNQSKTFISIAQSARFMTFKINQWLLNPTNLLVRASFANTQQRSAKITCRLNINSTTIGRIGRQSPYKLPQFHLRKLLIKIHFLRTKLVPSSDGWVTQWQSVRGVARSYPGGGQGNVVQVSYFTESPLLEGIKLMIISVDQLA